MNWSEQWVQNIHVGTLIEITKQSIYLDPLIFDKYYLILQIHADLYVKKKEAFYIYRYRRNMYIPTI